MIASRSHAAILLLGLVPAVVALVSIARSRPLSGTETVLWILAVLVAPLLGALLWFAIGRRRVAAGRDEGGSAAG